MPKVILGKEHSFSEGMKLRVSTNTDTSSKNSPLSVWGYGLDFVQAAPSEEVEEYLQNRAAKGFTVIQAYVLRGLGVRNVYGHVTLVDKDPTKFNEPFFENVDFVVNRANELGLVMGMVVSYGEHVRQVRSNEQVFNPSNAFAFGKNLATRKNNAIIWFLGGDRVAAGDEEVWTAMAKA
jgi:hypothetical protein